jgi:hypothetical protein
MVSPARVQEALSLLRRRKVVPSDLDTAEHYGSIASSLRKARKLDHRSHNDIWIASMENKLRTMQDDIVISDCRFPNEIKSIKNAGGLVIRVQRGPDPDWFVNTAAYFHGKCDLPENLPHASEWSWAGTEFDAVLDNNGTMDCLFRQVNDLVRDHQVSRVARAA